MTELFHYTNRVGLIGILGTREIWASDPLYLNDAGEILHGYRQLLEALDEETRRIDARQDPSSIQMARVRREINRRLESMLEAVPGRESTATMRERFVTSFSRTDDDLNQWRSYCTPGDGYAIGFDRSLLGQVKSWISGIDQSLWECSYGDGNGAQLQEVLYRVRELANRADAQRLLIPFGIEKAFGIESGDSRGLFEQIDFDVIRLSTAGIEAALKHKHSCFQSEQEQRLIVGASPDPIRYRKGKYFVIPYVGVPLTDLIRRGLITTIRVGPGPQLDLDLRAVRGYAERVSRELETSPPRVLPSELPFRG